jgi:hypothetical protein
MAMLDWKRIERLERALAQLASGVDWSGYRSPQGRPDLNEICGEVQAAIDGEALKQRAAALELELADLKGAA